MENLTTHIQAVFQATTLDAKKEAMLALIKASHGKSETKEKAVKQVQAMTNPIKVDSFAANYAMSGEGMKVF